MGSLTVLSPPSKGLKDRNESSVLWHSVNGLRMNCAWDLGYWAGPEGIVRRLDYRLLLVPGAGGEWTSVFSLLSISLDHYQECVILVVYSLT